MFLVRELAQQSKRMAQQELDIEFIRQVSEEILEESSRERRLSKIVEALREVYRMGRSSCACK